MVACAALGCADDGGACADASAQVVDPTGHVVVDACVELAISEQERKIGLSTRDALPPGEGLVIEFPVEGEVCITAEPVSFSFDAVFAAESGEVVATAVAIPAGDPELRCVDNVRRVLEVAAGEAVEAEVGDMLRVVRFGKLPD